jgi:carbamoyltransferase
MIALGNKNKIKILKKINYIHSLGHFYSAVTVVCGFRAIKDEGKITGLSARGKINFSLLKKFQNLIKVTKDGGLYNLMNEDLYLGPYPHTLFGHHIKKIRKITRGVKKYDICRTAQFFIEKIILQLVNFYQKKYEINNLCVAGGIFANVLINKRLYESKYTKNLYVHPAMTDSGLSTGSSLFHYYEKNQKKKRVVNNNIYLGPGPNNQQELIKALKKNGLSFYKPKKIEKEVAFLLSKGKVIARYCSSMEYGPRALGNRSILTNAQDINVNQWLNMKLKRSNAMPFAPVIMDKSAKKYFKNYNGAKHCTKFMTIALKVKKNVKKKIPGVVHIDGTARPQILRKKDNPKFYDIMKYYQKFSGHSCLLNTSFNLHDEPIVNTYFDAIKSFKLSKLDYMQCGNLLIANN